MPEINKYSGPFQPDLIYNASPWQSLVGRLPEVESCPRTEVTEGQEVA